MMPIEITLQYFDGCPNWKTTSGHLAALTAEGFDISVDHVLIDGYDEAVEKGFQGSPTVLIDGADPFADGAAPVGLFCRIYDTEDGRAGSPTRDQLHQAITAAQERLTSR